MRELHDWVDEKLTHRVAWVTSARRIAHKWERVTGGRIMSAGLTISIEPAETFTFGCNASDVPPEHLAAIRNGLFSVLMSQSIEAILGCSVVIESVDTHPVHSSQYAFFKAAQEAAAKLLGLGSPNEHNISW